MSVSRARRPSLRAVVPIVVLAAAAAACGGTGSTGNADSNSGSGAGGYGAGAGGSGGSSSSSAGAATVGVASNSNLGTYLVDGNGRTLYLFTSDKNGRSTCYQACASVWPPQTTSAKAKAGGAAKAKLLGTTTRKDGTTQVTYAGHPLYYYAPDGHDKGSTKGQGVKDVWYVVSPSGDKIEAGEGS